MQNITKIIYNYLSPLGNPYCLKTADYKGSNTSLMKIDSLNKPYRISFYIYLKQKFLKR